MTATYNPELARALREAAVAGIESLAAGGHLPPSSAEAVSAIGAGAVVDGILAGSREHLTSLPAGQQGRHAIEIENLRAALGQTPASSPKIHAIVTDKATDSAEGKEWALSYPSVKLSEIRVEKQEHGYRRFVFTDNNGDRREAPVLVAEEVDLDWVSDGVDGQLNPPAAETPVLPDGLYRVEFTHSEEREGYHRWHDLVATVIDGPARGWAIAESLKLTLDQAPHFASAAADNAKLLLYYDVFGLDANTVAAEELWFRPFIADVVDSKIVAAAPIPRMTHIPAAASKVHRVVERDDQGGWGFEDVPQRPNPLASRPWAAAA